MNNNYIEQLFSMVQGYETLLIWVLSGLLLICLILLAVTLHSLILTRRELKRVLLNSGGEGYSGGSTRLSDGASNHSEEKQIAADLRFTQYVLDNAAIGIFMVAEGSSRFTYVNKKACAISGHSEAELLSMKVEELVPHLSPEKSREYLARFRTEQSVSAEVFHCHKDGHNVPIESLAYLVNFEGKKVCVSFSLDITERQKAEQELATARLQAEEANRAKSDFLANMSHEIRTPMTAILGMSSLALKTDLTRKQRKYIESINLSAESLLVVINDILDFSKIEAGKMDIESIPFDLMSVFDGIASMLSLKVEEKALELLFDISYNTPQSLVGDPVRLGQVLVNLANNAVKFTEVGEVVIRAKVESSTHEAASLLFSVGDTGIGMTQQQQSQLFRSFNQADTSTSRKYGGTGLGLAISKSLVDMMGGRIWVNSSLGNGTTFHFTIAVLLQEYQQAYPTLNLESPDRVKVLIVDDSASARDILSSMLTSMGIPHHLASSGSRALEMIVDEQKIGKPYDIVFVDWRMPEMDGMEFSQAIINQHKEDGPKLILVTARSKDDAFENSQGISFDSILTKPVTASTLLDSVHQALGLACASGAPVKQRRQVSVVALSKLEGAHILLVEDNNINQDLAMELLTSSGIIVTLARDGSEALSALEQQDFDGVLMDCQMPVMDGYETTIAIRKQARFEDLPIIAMTANVMTGDKNKVLSVGMNDHIAKPIDISAMLATMAKWIKPRRPDKTLDLSKRASSVTITGSANSPDVASMEGEIPDIVGIDKSVGMRITQGNKALYIKLLGKFSKKYQNFLQSITAAEKDDDPGAALRFAHTLKSSSGSIGAMGVRDAVLALERAYDSGVSSEIISGLQSDVDSQLAPVLDGINASLNVSEAPGKSSGEEGERARLDDSQLEALQSLLSKGNANAADAIASLMLLNLPHSYADLLNIAHHFACEYDYLAALESIRKLRELVASESP